MVGPAGFELGRLKPLAKERDLKGPRPPTNWTTWTRKAEAWLREQIPEQAKGKKGRGIMPVFNAQTISRPQLGEGAYGANTKIRNLRLKQARIDRLKQLDSVGLGDILEARIIKKEDRC